MKFYKQEKGAAYLWVISITLIVTLLSFALIYIVTTDFKITNSYMYGVRAYYLAESGAELGVNMVYNDIIARKNLHLGVPLNADEISKDLTSIEDVRKAYLETLKISPDKYDPEYYDNNNKELSFKRDNPFTEYNTTNSYSVKIKTDPPNGAITTYKIASKGTYKDKTVRCIYVEFNVKTDSNNNISFPKDDNPDSQLKWTWQQISQKDFDDF